jgi:hypothetical protein
MSSFLSCPKIKATRPLIRRPKDDTSDQMSHDAEEESVTGGLRGGALSKRKGDLEDKNAAAQDRVVDEKDRWDLTI